MRLLQALRFSSPQCLAFAGAGGKTTALFQLARQVQPPVLVTMTTHLGTWQLNLADMHIFLERPADVDALEAALDVGVVLLTGPQGEDQRAVGLDLAIMERVYYLAKKLQISLLVEADGARQLPLKAPAHHEPAIPPFAEMVVLVAGLSALGKPLSTEWVHRPEQFAMLSGISSGVPITTETLERVLVHPMGGLKNIPPGARRVALLNQADTPDLQAQGHTLAKRLLAHYHAILIANLEKEDGSSDVQSGNVASGETVLAVHEPVAGIVLAAGGARRLGQPKQMLPWRGKPLVRSVVETALQTSLSPVVVVIGAYADQVREALQDLPITLVDNPSWEAGQSTSVKAGLSALPAETAAAVFLLADQPHIPPPLVRALIESHAQTLSAIVAPLIDGQRGNPVLFDRVTFPAMMELTGDIGGRALLSGYRVTRLEWHDRDVLLDVDEPDDYQRLLAMEGAVSE